MSKTIEFQKIEGTELDGETLGDVVVKVDGVERLRFGPVLPSNMSNFLLGFFAQYGCKPVSMPMHFDVSVHLPAGTACVASPAMPDDAPKGEIEQELEAMAARLDAMGTQLAEIAAAQVRMERQMAEIAALLKRLERKWAYLGGDVPPTKEQQEALEKCEPEKNEDLTDLTNLTDLTDLGDDAKGGPAL